MGKSQFIASSYRHYAIDFNGDGVRDLLNSNEDAVGSIASYLARHGWQRGELITAEASVTGEKYKKLVKKGLKPKVAFSRFEKYGVKSQMKFNPAAKAALIELEKTEDSKEHWVILKNFYAITRYNHSQLYAMAAYQLGQNIKRLKNNET
jgi:membrane-bound lytic murein transglycosylase B